MSKLISILTNATGLSETDIRGIIRNAPSRYKTYHIPKRSGGLRLISQPAREVKVIQRVFVTEILNHLPVHSSATAYRPGTSIRNNAQAHAESGVILKFDFKDFFPAIVASDWQSYCRRRSLFEDEEDVFLSTKILFHINKGSTVLRLAIGAPSSPCLSNILMHSFDKQIAELVAADQVTYTRYADDLTFSAKRTGFLQRVENILRRVIRENRSPRLSINNDKTVFATRKYKRMVTGLILSNDGTVSLGHNRKKNIRAAVHQAGQGRLGVEEKKHLAGLLAFAHDAEPDFLFRLTAKFGAALIEEIKAASKPTSP